jgi:hypothetical protein
MRIGIVATGLIILVIVSMSSFTVYAAKGKPTPTVEAGNQLSYPVIWAENVTKTLPGTHGMNPRLDGVYWYQWGTNGGDPDITPASCPPDPDEGNSLLNPDELPLCDDGEAGRIDLNLEAGKTPATIPLALVKAYLQKDVNNTWQAESGNPQYFKVAEGDGSLHVDWIDWGDNLESVDWYTRSQVRTEVVLFQDNPYPYKWLEYQMRHTSGWGIDEVHGIAADVITNEALKGDGSRATVYSHCARLTIQKLLVDRDDPLLATNLTWVPQKGWNESNDNEELINPPIFNDAVYNAGDGPGYYSAEINVKGRIIYGYTWNVRKLNEGPGSYRLTFSLDDTCGTGSKRRTEFVEGETQILVPPEEEEEVTITSESDDDSDTPGGTGELDFANNLTYMDINILERSGGGGGGGKKK